MTVDELCDYLAEFPGNAEVLVMDRTLETTSVLEIDGISTIGPPVVYINVDETFSW